MLLLAFALDALGEPPSRWHPVVWMGGYLRWMKRRNNVAGYAAFWQGAGLLFTGVIGVFVMTFVLVLLLKLTPVWCEIILSAVLLKPMFSFTALLAAGTDVKNALLAKDLPAARRLLAWHLVSRDTHTLSEADVAGAATESLAENLTDSVIAPLFYFMLFGLTGAVIYRFINTADAMLGYRTQELEFFGKAAARLDDVMNIVPARVSAALLWLALWLMRGQSTRGVQVALRAGLASPNAGWTMGMVAGGLNVRLDKRGAYTLNPAGRAACAHDITVVQNLLKVACLLAVVSACGYLGLKGV